MSNGTQEHNPNRNRNRNRNRSNNNRNSSQGSNPNKPRPVSQHQSFVKRTPAKLSFWQKLLKIIGLYKEPVRPGRSDAKPANTKARDEEKAGGPRPPRAEKQAPRSNTRDARSSGEARPPREPREQREPRAPRERREPTLNDVESTRLYIGNLSYDASESDIEELFKGVGPVRSVEIVYNKHTHKSKGYGFVEMLRIDEAKRAVEVLHDQHFMGRQLIVSGAKAKNAEDGEAAIAVREQKEQAAAQPAPAPEAAPVAATAPVATEEVASAPSAIVEEVHSLEAESQKETFV